MCPRHGKQGITGTPVPGVVCKCKELANERARAREVRKAPRLGAAPSLHPHGSPTAQARLSRSIQGFVTAQLEACVAPVSQPLESKSSLASLLVDEPMGRQLGVWVVAIIDRGVELGMRVDLVVEVAFKALDIDVTDDTAEDWDQWVDGL